MNEQIRIHNIKITIQNRILLDKANGHVHSGDVVGIVGANGTGKSTLLELIAGERTPSEGTVWMRHGTRIAMVKQEAETYETTALSAEQAELMAKWKVPAQRFDLLSGGEKLKVRLAAGFSEQADVLLLDEPTNHVDEDGLKLLVDQVKRYRGTVLLVSHDRAFLDEVATKIWSIEEETIVEHTGNYTSYQKERAHRRLTQQREYEKQQQKIRRIEGQLDNLMAWSDKAHRESTNEKGMGLKEYKRKKAKKMDIQVRSKRTRLENELEEARVNAVKPEHTVEFSFESTAKKGKRFLEVKDVTKGFGTRLLFEKASFLIQHGEKVALTGPNGSGKTTLLRMLIGEDPSEGSIWRSPSATIGYLTQQVFDLPLEKTPAELFYQDNFNDRGKVQNLLNHLGFEKSHWESPIKNMSMGERVKCKLMKYILEEKDVLILDEPTNHLDLPSREQLEETLAQYGGTLIVVSHDRYFLEKVTTSELVIRNGRIERDAANAPAARDNVEERRLQLETERQEVLGRLSFMTAKDPEYAALDQRFLKLTKEIRALEG